MDAIKNITNFSNNKSPLNITLTINIVSLMYLSLQIIGKK